MIQQKLTKTKTKIILITETLVIFPLFYTPARRLRPPNRSRHWIQSLLFQVIITVTTVSLLFFGKYVSKVSITVHEQKTPYSVD